MELPTDQGFRDTVCECVCTCACAEVHAGLHLELGPEVGKGSCRGGCAGLDSPCLGNNSTPSSLVGSIHTHTHTHTHTRAHIEPGTHLSVKPHSRHPLTGGSEPLLPQLSSVPLDLPNPKLHLLTSDSARLALWTRQHCLPVSGLPSPRSITWIVPCPPHHPHSLGPAESYGSAPDPVAVSLGRRFSLSHHIS